jgi:hypothetical protein
MFAATKYVEVTSHNYDVTPGTSIFEVGLAGTKVGTW